MEDENEIISVTEKVSKYALSEKAIVEKKPRQTDRGTKGKIG